MRSIDCLVSLAAGLGVGIGLGILFAPKPGREVREQIAGKTTEGITALKQRASDAQDAAMAMLEDGKQAVVDQKARIELAVEAGKAAYQRSASI